MSEDCPKIWAGLGHAVLELTREEEMTILPVQSSRHRHAETVTLARIRVGNSVSMLSTVEQTLCASEAGRS